MKIIITKKGGLAVDCRNNVYFNKGDIFQVGSKSTKVFAGLSKKDLEELVSLGFAKVESNEEGSEVESNEEGSEVDFNKIKSKDELLEFSKEKFNIELDPNLTLKKMKVQLETELGDDL